MTDILGLIRKNREARGWTEYQLAERSGLPQSTISSWYKKGMTPSFSSLEKICEAFGLTLSQFFADAEDRLALTPAQRALLDKWSRLTPGQQSSLLALMDAMREKYQLSAGQRSLPGARSYAFGSLKEQAPRHCCAGVLGFLNTFLRLRGCGGRA